MTHDIAEYVASGSARSPGQTDDAMHSGELVTHTDITLVVCVRLHAGNPWVIDRLKIIQCYYDPKPTVVIVDFGSESEYARLVEGYCLESGFTYVFVDDKDTYSPAIAHNVGFQSTTTEFILFSDADCVFRSDIVSELARLANALRMRDRKDIILDFPAHHLTEMSTAAFDALSCRRLKSDFLEKTSFDSLYSPFGAGEEFTAPYSNVYFIHRDMFDISGGYDASFRGHGSEDFEYFARIGMYSGFVPIPSNLAADKFRPLRDDFFHPRDYSGFRRLNETIALQSEQLGLKTYHLWHPREDTGEWRQQNDWKRQHLVSAIGEYERAPHRLLAIDFLPRKKTVVCVCKAADQWGYFLPLRLAGYRIIPLYDGAVSTIEPVIGMIERKEVDAVAIFNPYMLSHRPFLEMFLLAKDVGIETIVIERGALPGTIYYDTDVCYGAESFSERAYLQANITLAQESAARDYIAALRKGELTLEKNATYEFTRRKHAALFALRCPVCLVPLQLDDDMAVTMFVRQAQRYDDFVESLNSVILSHQNVVFVVKPHPLSKVDRLVRAQNLIIADREDNIHCLIDACSATICYNSGVGLLSIIHGKPTFTVGNAFYNIRDLGVICDSIQDAVRLFLSPLRSAPDENEVCRLVAWYLFHKYSCFIADDDIREWATRKAHNYKNILVTEFRWKATYIGFGRQREFGAFSWSSYGGARLSVPQVAAKRPEHNAVMTVLPNVGASASPNSTGVGSRIATPRSVSTTCGHLTSSQWMLFASVKVMVRLCGSWRKQRKLDAEPVAFFTDSKHPIVKATGAYIFGGR